MQCTYVECFLQLVTLHRCTPAAGDSACESPCHGDSLPLEVETNPPTWNEGSGLRPNLGDSWQIPANTWSLGTPTSGFMKFNFGACEVQLFSTENDLSTK